MCKVSFCEIEIYFSRSYEECAKFMLTAVSHNDNPIIYNI